MISADPSTGVWGSRQGRYRRHRGRRGGRTPDLAVRLFHFGLGGTTSGKWRWPCGFASSNRRRWRAPDVGHSSRCHGRPGQRHGHRCRVGCGQEPPRIARITVATTTSYLVAHAVCRHPRPDRPLTALLVVRPPRSEPYRRASSKAEPFGPMSWSQKPWPAQSPSAGEPSHRHRRLLGTAAAANHAGRVGVYTEQHDLVSPRAKLTSRATPWATDALTVNDTTVPRLAAWGRPALTMAGGQGRGRPAAGGWPALPAVGEPLGPGLTQSLSQLDDLGEEDETVSAEGSLHLAPADPEVPGCRRRSHAGRVS